jgi:copper chaperone CopZ
MRHISYHVPEMHCDACENSIRKSLGGLAGVGRVSVNLDDKQVQVEFDDGQTDVLKIKERIERAGFEVG